MTTEQENKLRDLILGIDVNEALQFVAQLETQAVIDALSEVKRIQQIQDQIPSSEYERYLDICARCGTFATYLACLIGQMTPDQRAIVAIQFDQNLFGTDEAMAKRFRDANNKDTINN